MSSLKQPSMSVSPAGLDCRWQPVQMTESMLAVLADERDPVSSMAHTCIGASAHYHRCIVAMSHLKARSVDSLGSLMVPVSFH